MYALRLRWCSSQIRHRSVRRTGSGMMPTLSRTTGAVDKPGRFMAAAVPTEKQGATLRDSTCSSKPLVDSDKTGSLTSSSGGSSRVYLVLLIVAVAGLLLMASGGTSGLRERVEELQVLIASSEYLGPVIFAAAYALFTVLLFPASLLTLAAGYLFGPVKGTALVSASSTLGASLAFLLSRYLVRPAVEAKLADYPRFQAVYRNISTDGAKLVLLLRLSPLIPFNLLNYGLGITDVSFVEYLGASWLGMLPGTFAYVYLGSLGQLATGGGTGGAGFDAIKTALYGVGAVATIWATKLISDAATEAIGKDSAGAEQAASLTSSQADSDKGSGGSSSS